ncbi:unnamed protein product, partial [Ectocarpus sp. 12 AP-2014]
MLLALLFSVARVALTFASAAAAVTVALSRGCGYLASFSRCCRAQTSGCQSCGLSHRTQNSTQWCVLPQKGLSKTEQPVQRGNGQPFEAPRIVVPPSTSILWQP